MSTTPPKGPQTLKSGSHLESHVGTISAYFLCSFLVVFWDPPGTQETRQGSKHGGQNGSKMTHHWLQLSLKIGLAKASYSSRGRCLTRASRAKASQSRRRRSCLAPKLRHEDPPRKHSQRPRACIATARHSRPSQLCAAHVLARLVRVADGMRRPQAHRGRCQWIACGARRRRCRHRGRRGRRRAAERG